MNLSLSRRRILRSLACAVSISAAVTASAQELWPDLSRAPRSAGGGERDAAVIVGIERYLAVEPVPGARRNAEDWQAYLTGTLKVPAERVALLRDNEATLEEMRQAASGAAAQAAPGGTLWFVFIGHGAPSADGKSGLLVGADAQQRAESLGARSLPSGELLALLAKGRQARTVVLLDACFSGRTSSGRGLAAGLQPLVAVRAAPPGTDARTVLITAARSDQFAGPLPGGSRPAFSYLALGALRGWAADAAGRVTAAGLVDYAARALKLAHDRIQTPELAAGAADLVLGSGAEPGPDLAKIDRARAASPGAGFQVSAPAAVPQAEAPGALDSAASGLDFRGVDIRSLGRYNEAFEFDKGPAPPEEKARQWRSLAKKVPQFAVLASQRARSWDQYAAQKKGAEAAAEQRAQARDADWGKLSSLLEFNVVPEPDKGRWAAQFVDAYAKSPGLEPEMARELEPHLAPGRQKERLAGLALRADKAGIAKWARIPGGSFLMGSPDRPDSRPVHRVSVPGFEMAVSLVTFKQYRACVAAGACTPPHASDGTCSIWNGTRYAAGILPASFQGPDQPVVCVDWRQARDFCEWDGGRLPSEAEWEYAARSAGQDFKYPWGNGDATCGRAVVFKDRYGCGRASTWPVCSKPKGNTEQGLCDMAGNAWEWVQDVYHPTYEGAPADGGAWLEPPDPRRVDRGGSWSYDGAHARADYRGGLDAGRRYDSLGFRPVR